MKRLKRNWIVIAVFVIFVFIFKYLVPLQFEYYLERDLITFSLKETLIIIVIIFLISILVFYRFLSIKQDKIIRITQTFGYATLVCFIYFVWLHSLVIAIGLFTNRIISSKPTLEKFKITYIMPNGEVGIKSINDNYFEKTEHKFNKAQLKNLKEKDTISIILYYGLLGKKHLNSKKFELAE